MSKRKGTTPSIPAQPAKPTEQTLKEWIAELQAISSRAFPGLALNGATKPAMGEVAQ